MKTLQVSVARAWGGGAYDEIGTGALGENAELDMELLQHLIRVRVGEMDGSVSLAMRQWVLMYEICTLALSAEPLGNFSDSVMMAS